MLSCQILQRLRLRAIAWGDLALAEEVSIGRFWITKLQGAGRFTMSAVNRAVRSFPVRSSSEGRRLGSAHYRQGQRGAVLEGSKSTGCRPPAFQASFPRRLVTLARTKGAVVWVKHRAVRLGADASRRSIFAHHGQYANGQGGSERPTKVQLRRLFIQVCLPLWFSS